MKKRECMLIALSEGLHEKEVSPRPGCCGAEDFFLHKEGTTEV
jgi:hypothetical protein